jgi:hypothetical protein
MCGERLITTPDQRREVPQQQQKNSISQIKRANDIRGRTSMNWCSRRLLILLVVIFLILIGIGVTGFYFLNKTSADVTIVWQSSSTSFTQQDQQNIQAGLKSELLAANSGNIAGHEFTIIDAQRQGDWAIFSASEQVNQDAKPIPTEPVFFIAHQQGTMWTVWMPGLSHFCDQLKHVPDQLLDPIDKHYFRGCYQ